MREARSGIAARSRCRRRRSSRLRRRSGFNSSTDYRIIAKHTGKVLDVYGGRKDDGANVYQWDWHGDNNQRWLIEQQSDGYYRIVSKNSGKVLDIRGNSTANNANVYQYGWHGGDNQQWKIEPL